MIIPRPVKASLRVALIYAALFSVTALASGGVHSTFHGQPFWIVVLAYLVGGLFVGCAIDLLRGWLTTRWRASVAGFVIAIPLALGTYLIFLPNASFKVMCISTAITGLLYGAGYGALFWKPSFENGS